MPPRLISFFGLLALMFLAWLMSSHRWKINPRIVVGGLAMQFALAVLILWTEPGRWTFEKAAEFFNHMLDYVEAGSGFLFNAYPRATDPSPETFPPSFTLLRTFAFGVLPTIIFFSSLMSVLYYLGIMQRIVKVMAVVMQRVLKISGAESLSAAANVFVGHTEAPLVIRPYVADMTRSELNAVMVGGFATISGGLLAAYAGMGIDVGHLLTASVISAPAALLIAKILEPETGQPKTMGKVEVAIERRGVNVIEAAAIGASDGMKLALNVAAMLIAFLALLALLDGMLSFTGMQFGFVDAQKNPTLTLANVLGYAFWPIAYLMGIPPSECRAAGELLGLKMVANEFVAYDRLGSMGAADLSARSRIIMTYALSGFSNFGAIGIQIGGIGGIAPTRSSDLAQLGLRAMIGGTIACCMTACVAGVLL